MVCVYCGSPTRVVNSRRQAKTNSIWRRRKCTVCSAITSSKESYVLDTAFVLRSKTGKLEPFSREKLLFSVYEACKHRKDATTTAESLTETIIAKGVFSRDGEVAASALNKAAYAVLKRFDRAAATAYRAFHPI